MVSNRCSRGRWIGSPSSSESTIQPQAGEEHQSSIKEQRCRLRWGHPFTLHKYDWPIMEDPAEVELLLKGLQFCGGTANLDRISKGLLQQIWASRLDPNVAHMGRSVPNVRSRRASQEDLQRNRRKALLEAGRKRPMYVVWRSAALPNHIGFAKRVLDANLFLLWYEIDNGDILLGPLSLISRARYKHPRWWRADIDSSFRSSSRELIVSLWLISWRKRLALHLWVLVMFREGQSFCRLHLPIHRTNNLHVGPSLSRQKLFRLNENLVYFYLNKTSVSGAQKASYDDNFSISFSYWHV